MQTLDLRRSNAADVLVCLVSMMTYLQTLKLLSVPCADPHLFLQSASHFANLHVEDDSSLDSTTISQCVSTTVGPQLLSLYLRRMGRGEVTWSAENIQKILTHCSGLQALGVDDDKHQPFGTWTSSTADLPPHLKMMHLVQTMREYVFPKRLATRHSRRRWYKASAYIQYPGTGRFSTYYVPAFPDSLEHIGYGTQQWVKEGMFKTTQLLERSGLATEASQNSSCTPCYAINTNPSLG